MIPLLCGESSKMKKILLLLSSLFLLFTYSFSQVKSGPPVPGGPPTTGESKPVEIIYADKLRTEKIDSVREVQTGAGKVQAKQGNTLFECDSFYYDKSTKVFEAFGNVHINDNDSINIYSNYLLYHVDTRIANLKKNVRLTDGKSTLTTQQLDYDLNQKIGNYYAGGKVANEKSVLTSTEATYFADTKDVYFKKNVVLIDPQYKLKSDSLLYNSESQVATFITKTYIEDTVRNIVTSSGYYDLKNKKAFFGKRPVINDGASQVIADNIDTDDSTGLSILTGKVSYKDTAQGFAMRGDFMKVNNKAGTLLATKNAVLIIKQDKDSLFVTADTLYSGKLSSLILPASATDPAAHDSVMLLTPDSVRRTDTSRNAGKSLADINSLTPATGVAAPTDSSAASTTAAPGKQIVSPPDSVKASNKKNNDVATSPVGVNSKTNTVPSKNTNASKNTATKKTVTVNKTSSPGTDSSALFKDVTVIDTKSGNDTADRYFQAYHRVRIFSDSLQAVGDSLWYSGKDSIFRLFNDPVMWASNSQVSGDTIYIYTKNKKAERVFVFENAIAVNKSGDNMFNQLKGIRMTGYFKDGDIDYMRARGNAESIYYAKDKEDYLVGINRVAGDIIDLRFLNKELNRVVVMNDVKGTMYPVAQIPDSEKRLRNFKWQEDRRPKTKFELFEPPKPLPPAAPATVRSSDF
ncbi:MAG: OstA family protein [Chitinophagaceae bacterium]|nr:MAG: OstA family protein [Chitinophagaceae bacterium]